MKNILIIMLSLLILGCGSSSEPVNNDNQIDLSGKWLITEVYLTNGPVCYDLKVGDTLTIVNLENEIQLDYTVFSKQRTDLFKIDSVNSTQIIATGEYFESMLDTNYSNLQRLNLTIDGSFIIIKISIQAYNYETEKIDWGDVAHFKAKKL